MFKPKFFKNKVRWNFRIAMHGWGRNSKEALRSALELMLYELENHSVDLIGIEHHELVSIDENDVDEE